MTDSDGLHGARTASPDDGRIRLAYEPVDDLDADPGEVVWAWVAYEEDVAQGKDRPMVVIGSYDTSRVAGLMLTSQEHEGDPDYHFVGPGPWDGEGRPSWARLDRVLHLDAAEVRREGAVLPRATFDGLVHALLDRVRAAGS